jgi:hypothetical protein
MIRSGVTAAVFVSVIGSSIGWGYEVRAIIAATPGKNDHFRSADLTMNFCNAIARNRFRLPSRRAFPAGFYNLFTVTSPTARNLYSGELLCRFNPELSVCSPFFPF